MVGRKTGAHPPFTHNLLTLLDRTELLVSPKFLKNLAVINEFNLSTRYPDEKSRIAKKFNANYSKKYLKIGTSIYQWLDEQKNL
jgi:HEPN domain-containing protein